MSGPETKVLKPGAVAEPLTYKEAKGLARHEDPKVRQALALRKDLRPEILYFLADDSSPQVRRAAAANTSTPGKANLKLASDADDAVRTDLAEKVARVVPELSAEERDTLRHTTHEALEILARDQITRVRQILSETLKDVADAPPDVIKTLARDTELAVAGPVLEFSPVLTDEDLLELIGSDPAQGGLAAISRRAQVHESVADAVAATDDVEAIADLLANPSAQIREETLDNLIDRAPGVKAWHAPLVGRPHLTSAATTRLAHFVADHLLDVLQERADLDAETLETVKTVVRHRIGDDAPDDAISGAKAGDSASAAVDSLTAEPPLAVAQRLYEAGKLGENVIAHALNVNDHAFVLTALTVRAELPVEVVQKVFSSCSAKGLVAVAWRGGLSMKLAVAIQQRMARIPPAEVLGPVQGANYPLGEEEMRWHLEFFSNLSD